MYINFGLLNIGYHLNAPQRIHTPLLGRINKYFVSLGLSNHWVLNRKSLCMRADFQYGISFVDILLDFQIQVQVFLEKFVVLPEIIFMKRNMLSNSIEYLNYLFP